MSLFNPLNYVLGQPKQVTDPLSDLCVVNAPLFNADGLSPYLHFNQTMNVQDQFEKNGVKVTVTMSSYDESKRTNYSTIMNDEFVIKGTLVFEKSSPQHKCFMRIILLPVDPNTTDEIARVIQFHGKSEIHSIFNLPPHNGENMHMKYIVNSFKWSLDTLFPPRSFLANKDNGYLHSVGREGENSLLFRFEIAVKEQGDFDLAHMPQGTDEDRKFELK